MFYFQSLMMSHSSTPGATPSSGPSSVAPPTSASSGGGAHPSSLGAYPVVPPPPSLITHPLTGHPHLAPPPHGLYHSQFTTDMLWKSTAAAAAAGGQRYGGIPPHIFTAAAQQSHSVAAVAEEMMAERERVAAMAMQDRDRHERMIRYKANLFHFFVYNIFNRLDKYKRFLSIFYNCLFCLVLNFT